MKENKLKLTFIGLALVISMVISAETEYVVTTFSGTANTGGSLDGAGTSATFKYPNSLSWALDGSIWIADRGNNSIRRMTTDGVVSTVAVAGAAGNFNAPWQGSFDTKGNYYVADKANNRIQKVTSDGVVTTFATGFKSPMSLVFDAGDNMYVSDRDNKAIKKITPTGEITTYVTFETFLPNCAVFDSKGNLLVGSGNTYTIVSVAPDGVVTTVAGDGSKATVLSDGTPGEPLTAEIGQYFGFAMDKNDVLYMADFLFNVVRTLTPDVNGDYSKGTVKTIIGNGTKGAADGNGVAATLNAPLALLFDRDCTALFIAESSHIIRKVQLENKLTNIAEISSASIELYPNPVKDFVNVTGCDVHILEIYDLSGRMLVQAFSNKVSLAGIPAGVYVAKVNGTCMKRLVVE